MIKIDESAASYFKSLLQQQDEDNLGFRIEAISPGTSNATCDLNFCPQHAKDVTDVVITTEHFELYIDAASSPFLEDASISYIKDDFGGELKITAPKLKGERPGSDAPLVKRIQYVIDSEINPALKAHRGMCKLIDVTAAGEVKLQFGGGCHGCGMVDVTLKQGIEKTLKQHFGEEISAVTDATNHATGAQPYFSA